MTVTTAKWSLDDYHRMIEIGLLAGRKVELLNGEIINMAPEGLEHAQINTDSAEYLREWGITGELSPPLPAPCPSASSVKQKQQKLKLGLLLL